jgi:hypothetical protein
MSNYTQSCDELRGKFEKHTPVGTYSKRAPALEDLAATVERLKGSYVDMALEIPDESEKSNGSGDDNTPKRNDT